MRENRGHYPRHPLWVRYTFIFDGHVELLARWVPPANPATREEAPCGPPVPGSPQRVPALRAALGGARSRKGRMPGYPRTLDDWAGAGLCSALWNVRWAGPLEQGPSLLLRTMLRAYAAGGVAAVEEALLAPVPPALLAHAAHILSEGFLANRALGRAGPGGSIVGRRKYQEGATLHALLSYALLWACLRQDYPLYKYEAAVCALAGVREHLQSLKILPRGALNHWTYVHPAHGALNG